MLCHAELGVQSGAPVVFPTVGPGLPAALREVTPWGSVEEESLEGAGGHTGLMASRPLELALQGGPAFLPLLDRSVGPPWEGLGDRALGHLSMGDTPFSSGAPLLGPVGTLPGVQSPVLAGGVSKEKTMVRRVWEAFVGLAVEYYVKWGKFRIVWFFLYVRCCTKPLCVREEDGCI